MMPNNQSLFLIFWISITEPAVLKKIFLNSLIKTISCTIRLKHKCLLLQWISSVSAFNQKRSTSHLFVKEFLMDFTQETRDCEGTRGKSRHTTESTKWGGEAPSSLPTSSLILPSLNGSNMIMHSSNYICKWPTQFNNCYLIISRLGMYLFEGSYMELEP